MNVIPLGDQIIVRRLDESTEQGGAHVGSRTPPAAVDRGLVIAVGTGRLDSDSDHKALAVKAGDTVVFGRDIGVNLVFGGVAYLIMNRTDVVGIEAVSTVSTSLPRRSDGFVGEPARSKGASYGPHRIVVWSTLEEGHVDAALDHGRSRQNKG